MLAERLLGWSKGLGIWPLAGWDPARLEIALNRFGRAVMGLYTRSMLDMDVRWQAPLPAGPKIVAANHPTTTDPFYLTTLVPETMSILVTGAAFEAPLLGPYLRLAGHVPVIHGHGRAAFDEALTLLEAGRTVAIFPEGALSPLEGDVHPPRTGAARLALITGAPVVPVGIGLRREGMHVFEPEIGGKTERGIFYPRGPYAMTVGAPLRFRGDVADRALVRAVSERIMERIVHLSDQSARRLRAAPAAARSSRPVPTLDTRPLALTGAGERP